MIDTLKGYVVPLLAGGGLLLGAVVAFTLGAISGAIGTAVTAVVVAGGLYLLGFVTMGTAQAAFLVVVSGGALLGGVIGILQAVLLGASL